MSHDGHNHHKSELKLQHEMDRDVQEAMLLQQQLRVYACQAIPFSQAPAMSQHKASAALAAPAPRNHSRTLGWLKSKAAHCMLNNAALHQPSVHLI